MLLFPRKPWCLNNIGSYDVLDLCSKWLRSAIARALHSKGYIGSLELSFYRDVQPVGCPGSRPIGLGGGVRGDFRSGDDPLRMTRRTVSATP